MLSKVRSSAGIVLRSPWFWIVIIGYLLRLVVMPIMAQNDLMYMPWMAHFINLGDFNVYGFLYDKFGEVVIRPTEVWAPYPYGFYSFTALWSELLDKVGLVDLTTWDVVWHVEQPARYVFLFKAAYLPFDLAIGYLLFRTVGPIGLALWAWSPLAIYTPYMMGQNDIYPTAFAVAGTYAASRAIDVASQNEARSSRWPSRWALAMSVLLGIGSIFKIYPIFLLPPLILLIESNWWRRLLLLLAGVSFLLVASFPFLDTKAYLEGVILNPEGAKLFQESQLLGIDVSPFLLAYLLLLGYFIVAPERLNPRPRAAWFTSLIVLAILLLWAPVQSYWIIWIIPFLIAVADSAPRILSSWLLLQVAFAISLLAKHRELGAALPVKLATIFQVPNLPDALAATEPVFSRLFLRSLPFVNALFVIGLLVAIWYSVRALVAEPRPGVAELKFRWWMALPLAVLLLGLAVNLYVARDLVSVRNISSWTKQELSSGDYLLQEVTTERDQLTGLRLKIVNDDQPATLQLCLYEDRNVADRPLACATRASGEQGELDYVYFTFDDKGVIDHTSPIIAKIELVDDGGPITLRYTKRVDDALQINEATLNGSLDIAPLYRLDLAEAYDVLVVTNVLKDRALLVVMSFSAMIVVVFVGLLTYRHQKSALT